MVATVMTATEQRASARGGETALSPQRKLQIGIPSAERRGPVGEPWVLPRWRR